MSAPSPPQDRSANTGAGTRAGTGASSNAGPLGGKLSSRLLPQTRFGGPIPWVIAILIALVVIAVLNSALSAWYYRRLVGLPLLARPNAQSETIGASPVVWPRIAAIVTAIAIVVLPIFCAGLLRASESTMATTADAVESESESDRALALDD